MDPKLYQEIVGFLSNDKMPDTPDPDSQRLAKKVINNYALIKNELYKLDESRQGTLSSDRGRQHRNCRLVIPRTKMTALLKQLHDHPLSGHQGQDNTYIRVSEHYYWPGMREDVIKYVRSCDICQKRKRRQGEAPLEPIRKHPIPFYQVGIDVMGPLPKTLTGFRYIVVAVDHFTKWVEARAIADADAQSIVQ